MQWQKGEWQNIQPIVDILEFPLSASLSSPTLCHSQPLLLVVVCRPYPAKVKFNFSKRRCFSLVISWLFFNPLWLWFLFIYLFLISRFLFIFYTTNKSAGFYSVILNWTFLLLPFLLVYVFIQFNPNVSIIGKIIWSSVPTLVVL